MSNANNTHMGESQNGDPPYSVSVRLLQAADGVLYLHVRGTCANRIVNFLLPRHKCRDIQSIERQLKPFLISNHHAIAQYIFLRLPELRDSEAEFDLEVRQQLNLIMHHIETIPPSSDWSQSHDHRILHDNVWYVPWSQIIQRNRVHPFQLSVKQLRQGMEILGVTFTKYESNGNIIFAICIEDDKLQAWKHKVAFATQQLDGAGLEQDIEDKEMINGDSK